MSNSNTIVNSFAQNIVQFIQMVQTLRTQNDQFAQDPGIVVDYFKVDANGVNSTGGRPRKDIVEQDVKNAQDALTQVFFTLDSGAPTQKSFLYKMQP